MSFMMPNNRKKTGPATVPASSYDTDVPPEWKINDTPEVAPEIQGGIFGAAREEDVQAPFGLNTGAPVAMASSRNVLIPMSPWWVCCVLPMICLLMVR